MRNLKQITPHHPDPCWLGLTEKGHNGKVLGCSAANLFSNNKKRFLIVFSDKETTEKYIQRLEIQNGAPICLSWNEIINCFGKFFDGAIVNPPIGLVFCHVVPLKKDEYYTYSM